jgi:hypothetical protein
MTKPLSELVREASEYANAISSVASSDPWWVLVADWLAAHGVAESTE